MWAAIDDAAGPVAVKVAPRRDPAAAARFDAEARALARIGPPAVPRLVRRCEAVDGRAALVMERLRGQELAAWLAAQPAPPSLARWRELAAGLARALAAVHRAGYVHRDLKPENAFLRDDGAVALLDLGLVAAAVGPGDGLTRAGEAVGTALYAAPEQLRGERVGPAADVYALGAMLYELATLRVPFVGDAAALEHAHQLRRPAAPSAHHAAAAPIDELVLACLAKAPTERPADADAVLGRLAGAARAPGVASRGGAAPAVTLRTSGERPVVLVGVQGARVDLVAALARAHGATVARVHADRCVLALADDDAPLERGLALAAAAAARVPLAVVHLAAARVRRDPARPEPRLFGAALDAPAAWWPPEGAHGALVTAAAGALAPEGLAPSAWAGFLAAAPRGGAARLLGRAGELEALAAFLDDAGAALVTVVGEPGVGKSALAAHAAAAAPGRQVLRHDGRGARGGDGVVELAGAVLAAAAPALADPAAACARLLGDEAGRAAWAALAAPPASRRQLDAARALASLLAAAGAARPLLLVLDDADAAAPEVLDAVELATSDAAAPLAVLAVAAPRLLAQRPRWGARAARALRVTLGPLAPADAAEVLAGLLVPATRIPASVLGQLAAWAGGAPRGLEDVARALRQAGAIRPHPGSDEWYVAADALAQLPPTASAAWLAGRALAALTPDLAELARLCAVLGEEVDEAEVAAVQDAVALAADLDPRAGLEALARADLLVRRGRAYRFRLPSLHEGCLALTEATARAELHRRAMGYWLAAPRADASVRIAKLAYHGERGGRPDEARACHLALATDAARRHAHREAEQHLGAALALCGDDAPAARLQALAARGAARRHLTHYEQARADLREARALAARLGDRVAEVEALVAESAVCDFLQRYGEAAELAEEAARRAAPGVPPATHARLANWLGVARFHQARDGEAIELLGLAVALGAAVGDHESATGAALIAAHALVRAGRVVDGQALLDQAIARCREAGDYFHLACAHSNRVVVWRELGQPERATGDLEAVVAIARDFGFALLEAAGLANLAEHLCWLGRLDEALAASGEAHRQGVRRFRDQPLAVVSLYHAQLLVLAGRDDDARQAVAELGAVEVGDPAVAIMRDAVALALGGPDDAWPALHRQAAALAGGLQPVELLWLEGRRAARAGALGRARARLAEARDLAAPTAPELAAVIARELDALPAG